MPRPSPDKDLASENYPGLNAMFYEARPHDYFGQRLSNLILVAGKRSGLEALMAEGVTFGDLSAPAGQPSCGSAEERDKAAELFVTAETEVLCHHAGETLLRLYLAHEGLPPCPWLEVSRVRYPRDFKVLVKRRFGPEIDGADPKRREALAKIFYSTDSRERLEPMPSEESWNESLRVIEMYLRHFARQFIDKAALYNATKHGLAVMPSTSTMQYNDGALVSADGPAIEYLYLREREDGQSRWYRGTHWVKRDVQMAFAYRACQLIDMLWTVAKSRYLQDVSGDGVAVELFGPPTPADLQIGADARGVVTTEMGTELLYYRPEGGPDSGHYE